MTDDVVHTITLTDDERWLLCRALSEWGGPARCTHEFAVAMGFANVEDLFQQARRIRDALQTGESLTTTDWTRALLSLEIVFVSDVIGSGTEWQMTTGLDDVETLGLIRDLQRKLWHSRVLKITWGAPQWRVDRGGIT